jgi:hypothetical protein
MPKQPTKGKTTFSAEVRTELIERFREYVRGRGERMTDAIERALGREMAYPPPLPEPPPLPPLPDAAPAAPKRGATAPRAKRG